MPHDVAINLKIKEMYFEGKQKDKKDLWNFVAKMFICMLKENCSWVLLKVLNIFLKFSFVFGYTPCSMSGYNSPAKKKVEPATQALGA